MADKEEQQDEPTIAQDIVVTKYKMAGDMANDILKQVVEKCVAGAKIVEICEFGDKLMLEETGKVFKKNKEMKKGIAFPCCLSVNNCICHFSPLKSDPDVELKDGDLVKIDMGVHIDGFSAMVAHTLVVGATVENKVKGRKADAILAAYWGVEAALRLVKPGEENYTVTEAIQKVAESFKCKPIEGMLSYQIQHHRIDGDKAIIQNPNEAQRKEHEKCEFEVHEVYAIDVLVSTGEGKGREMDARTTVYKKKDLIYQLKMKASRQFFSEVQTKFSNMPFTLRAFEDEKKAKMGVVECVKHGLVESYNVLFDRENEYVAQFKFTVLLMPNGTLKITGLPFDPDVYESEHQVEDEKIKALLSTSANRKAAKKKKKKAEKAISEGATGAADAAQAAES
ncbi:proliferation-associated protein 2G4 [Lingula anatina]|uniref:Proliferation-associated protein 2G4 n=2 Tax=Lingula anatina TaxID=7574 RepID=A0A1S3HYV6_LINAN|nr:proliferation-associated protein 2G4 [Lingula anatina]|eukprot:XP_013391205.1 proliferation-associated protein 2G4 [Lingula anatina]